MIFAFFNANDIDLWSMILFAVTHNANFFLIDLHFCEAKISFFLKTCKPCFAKNLIFKKNIIHEENIIEPLGSISL